MTETTKGFEFALNLQEKILRIRVWGDWDETFRKKYDLALRDKILELSAEAHWQIWYILMDFSGLAAIAEEVQAMLGTHLPTLQKQGVKKIAYFCHGHPCRLPLRRARDKPLQSAFESKEEAMTWLLNV